MFDGKVQASHAVGDVTDTTRQHIDGHPVGRNSVVSLTSMIVTSGVHMRPWILCPGFGRDVPEGPGHLHLAVHVATFDRHTTVVQPLLFQLQAGKAEIERQWRVRGVRLRGWQGAGVPGPRRHHGKTQDPRPHVDAGGHDHRGSGDHRVFDSGNGWDLGWHSRSDGDHNGQEGASGDAVSRSGCESRR